MKRTLGTQLRHLIELLDGAVAEVYADARLDYRPRFTPVVRALTDAEPLSIGQIAVTAGITQPAATQTVALMLQSGIATSSANPTDGRQRLIRLTAKGRSLLPRLNAIWQATAEAATSLDADLQYPFSAVLEQAIEALEKNPFKARILKHYPKPESSTETAARILVSGQPSEPRIYPVSPQKTRSAKESRQP